MAADAISAMNQAAEKNAQLMAASTTVSTAIQGASSSAASINAANAAGTEQVKQTANDMRSSAKAS